MKLNIECVRKTLLAIEKNYTYGVPLRFDEIEQFYELSSYDQNEIDYVLIKLYEGGYLSGEMKVINGSIADFYCDGLTWAGHELLDNVRDNKIWAETKNTVSKLSSVSVSILSSVASQAIAKMLNLN